jgi:hypothetical protein
MNNETDVPGQRTLAFDELSEWTLTLKDGHSATVFADSYGEDGDDLVFDIAITGTPLRLMPVARLPMDLVVDIRSKVRGVDPADT